MGRRRNNRRRKKGKQSRLAHTHWTVSPSIDQDKEAETKKEKQKEELQKISEKEKHILSRTIKISNVKDLRIPGHSKRLENFLTANYGYLEEFRVLQPRKRKYYPEARARFRSKVHAEAIFGGKPLIKAMTEPPVLKVAPGIAHERGKNRGYLRIEPSTRYKGMLEEVESKMMLRLETSEFRLGHWFPALEDGLNDDDEEEVADEFLQEKKVRCDGYLAFDLAARSITLNLRDEQSDIESMASAFSMIIGDMANDTIGVKQVLTVRFKELLGRVSLVRSSESGDYALLFRVKHPPKIQKVIERMDRDHEIRLTTLKGVEEGILGRCHGYMIRISNFEARQKLFMQSHALQKLIHFGIYDRYHDESRVIPIRKGDIRWRDNAVFPNEMIGLQLRQLIDTGKTCAHYFNNDTAEDANELSSTLLELVQNHDERQVLKVLNIMNDRILPTKFPAKVMAKLLFEEQENEKGNWDQDDYYDLVPSFCVVTPRVHITPTKTCVMGTYTEMSNRVLRHFCKSEQFSETSFMRVSFADENGEKLFGDGFSTQVSERFQSFFENGLRINGVHYKFLAFSSSQLKECSIWMVAPKRGWTVKSMRSWMGDFWKCKTAPKLAARMGQCFSATVETATDVISQAAIARKTEEIKDIASSFPDSPHSDGTGLIDRDLLKELLLALPSRPADLDDVSIVQVRFGGAKGTLTAFDLNKLPNIRRKSSSQILLRPSMLKFDAKFTNLEIVAIGKQIPYYLNRHVILLLRTHGVPESTFQDSQEVMLNDLDQMLVNPSKALGLVPRLGGADSGLSRILMKMMMMGLGPEKDAFIQSCLHAVRSHHLMNLRKKTRVFVEKGAVLIGGLDEMKRLPEGCVFVQVRTGGRFGSDSPNGSQGEFTVLTGPVMVTKHPVMHPGDVRMLMAVDIKEFHDKRNVILFSQNGREPEPHKMAGSDLDGDQFAVTWDCRFFLGHMNGRRGGSLSDCIRANKQPLDYDVPAGASAVTPTEALNMSFVDQQLCSHFINFAKNDNLGRISNMWLDYAAKNGADCHECLELAKLSSIAVDFPKSGIPAEIPRAICLRSIEPRPHWRERKGPSYDCTSVIGKMYDSVRDRIGKASSNVFLRNVDAICGRVINKKGQLLCFLQDFVCPKKVLAKVFNEDLVKNLGVPSVPDIDFALAQRDDYNEQLSSLMTKYNIQSEGEVVTGCILKFHKQNKRRQHDVAEEVRRQCAELRKEHRTQFFLQVLEMASKAVSDNVDDENEGEFAEMVETMIIKGHEMTRISGSVPKDALMESASTLAAAYYLASYDPEIAGEGRCLLFSFPWIVADVMFQCLIHSGVLTKMGN